MLRLWLRTPGGRFDIQQRNLAEWISCATFLYAALRNGHEQWRRNHVRRKKLHFFFCRPAYCDRVQSETLRARGHWRGHSSEEHTPDLQSLMRHSYAVFCLQRDKRSMKTLTANIQSLRRSTLSYFTALKP